MKSYRIYILHGYVHGVSSLPLKQHFADLIMTRLIDILWHWLTSRDQIWLISGLDSGRYIRRGEGGREGVTWVWLEFHDEFWQQMRVVVLDVEAGQVHTLVPGGYWHYLDNLGQIICEIAGHWTHAPPAPYNTKKIFLHMTVWVETDNWIWYIYVRYLIICPLIHWM